MAEHSIGRASTDNLATMKLDLVLLSDTDTFASAGTFC